LRKFIYKDCNQIFDIKKNLFFDFYLGECIANNIKTLPIKQKDIQDAFIYNSPFNNSIIKSLFKNPKPFCWVFLENQKSIDFLLLCFECYTNNIKLKFCLTLTFLDYLNFVSFQIFNINSYISTEQQHIDILGAEDICEFWMQ